MWAPEDEKNASPLQPLIDIYSWIRFKISRWQSDDELEDAGTSYGMLWLLVPLVIILFWRLYFKERIQLMREKRDASFKFPVQGEDSELYRLIGRLERMGYNRHNGETLLQWFNRIDSEIPAQKLMEALKLHYQYRFDPRGLKRSSKEKLYSLVTELMNAINPST